MNNDSLIKKQVKTLKMATMKDNADILTEIRDIVRGQLTKLKQAGTTHAFTAAQAGILHKLAQTYAILDSHTDKEHEKYNYSSESSEALNAAAIQARAMLDVNDE